MELQELITTLREKAKSIDISGTDFLAVQINITDKQPGVFYIEVKNDNVNIEPYEYNDRNCAISISMANFQKLMAGKLDPVAAFTLGKLKVDGDLGKALEFSKLIKM